MRKMRIRELVQTSYDTDIYYPEYHERCEFDTYVACHKIDEKNYETSCKYRASEKCEGYHYFYKEQDFR